MDKYRAKQILESHGVIEVTYKDSPVWIEQVIDDDKAEITDLESSQRMDVDLEQLVESSTNI